MSGNAPKPNFFIVGAPKSGTTALYAYLRQHPEVFMCHPKEPQFFADDALGNQRTVSALSAYLACFRNARAAAIGEASTCYLGSPSAAHKIKEFAPNARIIIMLRDPIEVMYAEHSTSLFIGTEHIVNFRRALYSNEPRFWRSGRFQGQAVVRLPYRELVRFPRQVSKFLEVFGQSNVHIIIYDDFLAHTRLTYERVLSFLQVATSHRSKLKVVNANRRVRSVKIQDFLRHPPGPVRALAHSFLGLKLRRAIGNGILRLNTSFTPRPPLEQEFRMKLELDFIDEVNELGRLIHRDLSCWLPQATSQNDT